MSRMITRNSIHEMIKRNIPLGFLLVNRNGEIIEFNEAAETISGFSKSEVIGKPHCHFFNCNSVTNPCLLLEPGWEKSENIVETESSIINKKGELVILSVTTFPLKDDNDNFLGAVELFRNISRRSRMEKERKHILAMFAHDIKNPAIASALFVARILAEKADTLTDHQRSSLDIVLKNIKAIIDHADNFLTFSLFDEKQYIPQKMAFDLVAAILQIIESEKAEAKSKEVTVNFERQDYSPLIINADRQMVDRVISNILGNALKYSNPGGTITISVARQNSDLHLSIADTGIGIPDKSLPYIFDPFFRENNDCRGSGLGLAISKSIVEAHKGRLYAESRQGKGSTFHCILPMEMA